MLIESHLLHDDGGEPCPFRETPNVGGALTPRYLVMHYTAGRSAGQSLDWLTQERARASAHLVIARDGTVTQLAPFDRITWHAGRSSWDGLEGLNAHSVGIELDNAGRLERQGGAWRAWFGTTYPDDEVMEAVHKHEREPAGWHVYTSEQIDAALEAALLLVRRYDLLDVIGHEDISPGRKSDPGPAFPMASFRSRLFGRTDDSLPLHETTAALNVREGAGTGHAKLSVSPLPEGTRVQVLDRQGSWRFVDVEGEVRGELDVQGWVHGRYLRRVE